MTKFKIHVLDQSVYRFQLHFITRFLPAILAGNKCTDRESCLKEIKITQQQILNAENLAFTRDKRGYGFTVFSSGGRPVAHSRFFPTQHLMKRILSILQKRICSASVQGVSGFLNSARAA